MRNLLRPVPFFFLVLAAVSLAGCPKKKIFHPEPDLRGFGEFVLQDVKGAGWNTKAVILGDVDGDGDLDAFVANYGEQNRLLINDGNGEFADGTDTTEKSPTGLPLMLDRSRCAVFGDVDEDGDLDIVVGNHGQNRLLINDGAGEFTDGTDPVLILNTGLPSGTEDTWALALLNVDAEGGFDGDLDLVLVNEGQDRLFLNDGSGEFLDGTDLGGVYTTGLPMDGDPGRGLLVVNVDADVSGDADADLVILNEGAPNRLLINSTGLGEFTDASFDTMSNAASLSPLAENSRSAACADVNGDGLIDLIVANDGRNRIMINLGAGFFTDGSSEWIRERVKINGRLNAVHGTSPVPTSIIAAGRSFDGSPPSLFGAVRQSPGTGAWNVEATNLTQIELEAVWAAPGSVYAFAVGRGGTVLSNWNTLPVGTWADLSQPLTGADLFAATGTSPTNVYFAGDEGTILRYDGTVFILEREFTNRDLMAVWGHGSGGFVLGGQSGTLLSGGSAGFARETSGVNVQINDLWGDSPANLYAVGTGGTVLHYWTQGGTQPLAWYPENTSTLLSLNAVTGRGGEIWSAGDFDFQANEFTLLRDQGSGWTAMAPGLGYGENLLAIWVDPSSGDVFAAGENEVMLRWDASASTWYDDTPGAPTSLRYVAMHGTSAANVAVVGEDGALAHFNGTSWTRHDVTPASTEDLTGIWLDSASTHAWVTGADGTIYSLDMSSWTWTPVMPPPTTRSLMDVWGESASDVYAVGETGTLLHYDGSSWRLRESGRIDALFALDATHIFAVGPAGLVLEGDGAGNWTAHSGVPSTVDLMAVWASTLDQHVWAVGRGGRSSITTPRAGLSREPRRPSTSTPSGETPRAPRTSSGRAATRGCFWRTAEPAGTRPATSPASGSERRTGSPGSGEARPATSSRARTRAVSSTTRQSRLRSASIPPPPTIPTPSPASTSTGTRFPTSSS